VFVLMLVPLRGTDEAIFLSFVRLRDSFFPQAGILVHSPNCIIS
jgi:hypothetical protein